MNPISSKITAGAIAGALAGIIVWALGYAHITVPAEVGMELSTLLAFGVGWLVPETSLPVFGAPVTGGSPPSAPAAPVAPSMITPAAPAAVLPSPALAAEAVPPVPTVTVPTAADLAGLAGNAAPALDPTQNRLTPDANGNVIVGGLAYKLVPPALPVA